MWELWWKKWHRNRFITQHFSFPPDSKIRSKKDKRAHLGNPQTKLHSFKHEAAVDGKLLAQRPGLSEGYTDDICLELCC
jgi:hypothetical protein